MGAQPLQITDLNTLIELESSHGAFMEQTTYSEMEKTKRLVDRKPE
jgi:hypothetical protein